MFRFAEPNYLNLLYLIPILIGLYIYFFISKKKSLDIFANKKLHSILFGRKSFLKDHFKFSLIIISIILLILSIAKPQLGSKMEEVKQSGIDIYILLDVSLSMNAEDLKPNRLEQAKNEISSLIKKLDGDRIGLVIFAGEPYIQFPLTADYSAANLFLSAVNFNSIPTPGTAIASAITMATKSFDYSSKTQKAIVIITDGEDHEGNIDKAIDEANDKGIIIYTIGMGSPTGSPIPIYDNRGNQIDFKKDENGNLILTKLDELTLQNIASKSNGKYYLATGSRNELDEIYKDLSKLEETEFGTKKITDYEDKYFYFLIPALLILILEFFISDTRSNFLDRILRKT
ncbi:MAG: VWA domain-containing protein [Ignavibacterium sp.]